MQIYTDLQDINISERTAVALGNFDGVHVGHIAVMEAALNAAAEQRLKSLCFTFSNHPFNFIMHRTADDDEAVKYICTEDEKIKLLEKMGFDILVNIPFDETIMTTRADSFFNDIIVSTLNAGYVSVGFNYTYGVRAEGKSEDLIAACDKAGIGVSVHDAVKVDDTIVSSTLIRNMISVGDMEAVEKYLGRPLSFDGVVKHGKHIGTGNGVPTINIPAPKERIHPPHGVYFSRITVGGKTYDSISNIGVNPTVNDDPSVKTIETFIFDFDEDVYGDDVTVYFYYFSRGERRFGSKEELFAQINSDCEDAKKFHENRRKNGEINV